MSWFDATGLANIAKTALKEAQKTIDKALDIKDDEGLSKPVDASGDDLLSLCDNKSIVNENISTNTQRQENQKNAQSSLWGSFTGSFFETSKETLTKTMPNLSSTIEFNENESKESLDLLLEKIDGDVKSGSDSVEIITPYSENTSPDSDASLINSPSTFSDGIKQSSTSVEVLPESLVTLSGTDIESSSSIDLLGEQELLNNVIEQQMQNVEKLTPDSIETLPHEIASLSEDSLGSSLTSPSESFSTTALEKTVSLQSFTLKKGTEMINSLSPVSVKREFIEHSSMYPEAITTPPSRNNNMLPLTTDKLIDIQPQSSKEDIPELLKVTNVIDIPPETENPDSIGSDNLNSSLDDGFQSDRTLRASCSTIENTEQEEIEKPSLRNLLADAMSEKYSDKLSTRSKDSSDDWKSKTEASSDSLSMVNLERPIRDSSPLSSERSDLVKIGSDHTSGHTSGDEVETGTSSDIEIISNPNGDSSSTQSRHSPAKLTYHRRKDDSQIDSLLCKITSKSMKGHNRELSEASSTSEDSHVMELENLLKKISEMSEMLELREAKIIDINRKNMELHELNMELQTQLDQILSKQLESQNFNQITEEYTQRMSIIEKKFQQAIREKDDIRKQFDYWKEEAASRLTKGECDSMIKDKDDMIKQLREEGEKLSKQQLQHSNIIKKLRAKEKENETAIKNLKEKSEDLSSETERLKRSLSAKEEVERTQIEAVHQLTERNKKLENDLAKTQSNLDDYIEKYDTVKKSLEAARKELNDKNRISNQLTAKDKLVESLENEKKIAESQNEEVVNQLQYLRQKLHESESEFLEKERKLKLENNELLKRIENAETRNEELSQSFVEVSKPLVRQLESLQATHNMKVAQFEKIEMELTSKKNELQSRLQAVLSSERITKEECLSLRTKITELETELSTVKHQKEMLEMQLERCITEKETVTRELESKIKELEYKVENATEKIQELQHEVATLRPQFIENSLLREHNESLHQVPNIPRQESHEDERNSRSQTNSPTLSIGKASVADSLASSVWSQIESFDTNHTLRINNVLEMHMLQSNLQQREGELQQLQWELNRREHERSLINQEMSALSNKVDEFKLKIEEYDALKLKFDELTEQYDVLCQMYGEKVDENEELKLDLNDVKEMYKNQIDELLGQQKLSR